MAVLIVDRDPHSREAVRLLLREMGAGVVLEAKSGDEALRTLAQERSKIRFILSEYDIPGLDGMAFANRVASYPEQSATPFLMMTSDELYRGKLKNLPSDDSRLDGILLKPFRQAALEKAMSSAYAHRKGLRNLIVYFGSDSACFAAITWAIGASGGPYWKEAKRAESPTALREIVATEGARLGALVIEPGAYATLEKDWLGTYRKTQDGTQTLFVALSREPAEIHPLRSHCQYFIAPDRFKAACPGLLARLADRAQSGWDRECIGNLYKAALRSGDLARAEKYVQALLKLDVSHGEILCFAGDLFAKKRKLEHAILYYELSLEANPCFPQPYIKLLELMTNPSDRRRVAEQAARFCPDHGFIQKKVAQVLAESGSLEKTETNP